MKRRVVITGVGAVTCIGTGRQGFWDGIKKKRSGISFINRFNAEVYNARCAGQIHDFVASDYFPPHKLKRLDRYSQFALLIAKQALDDAGVAYSTDEPTFDVGCSFGTALGGITTAEIQHERFIAEGRKSIPPALALQVFGGSAHSNIAINYGLRGYGTTNSNSCASGTVAIGEAYRVIRDGLAEKMVAGAAEAPLSPLTYGAFDVIKTMAVEQEDAATACRPFDVSRTGFVMAEGGASVMLETLDDARARGAEIICEVVGYSLNNDAHHMTSSLPGGASAIKAMEDSINEAGIEPGDIDYINAHASSTMMNDDSERDAIIKVFGEKTPPLSGTKAYYGHPLGASGAIEGAICALAMQESYIPPTLNCHHTDTPEGFDIVQLEERHKEMTYVLSNSFGFGGINSTLVFKKYDGS
ncbi:MAG: beta-ketoacyl-[acyl-carrier-protein] synthase family protein [Verrucomicrobiota bacterium]